MSRMILSAVGVCFLAAAAVAADEKADKYVRLVNGKDGKVLAVADGSDENGSAVVLAKADDGDETQQWKLEKDGDAYRLMNRKSGRVLDVSMNSTEEGGAIIIWNAKGEENDNQRWTWDGDEKAKGRRLKGKGSGLVLDVNDEGKVVQKKADPARKEQVWEVVEIKK